MYEETGSVLYYFLVLSVNRTRQKPDMASNSVGNPYNVNFTVYKLSKKLFPQMKSAVARKLPAKTASLGLIPKGPAS